MYESIIIGGGFAFAAALQPGPFQAYLLSRVTLVGWKRTLPAAFAPLISDGPIAILMLTVLHYVAGGLESILRGTGGVVLLFIAVRTFLDWRRGPLEQPVDSHSPGTLMLAARTWRDSSIADVESARSPCRS